MKKILCLIDILGYGGGAERQMAGLSGMLKAKGYDVHLATYHKHEYNNVLREKYNIESVFIDGGTNPISKLFAVRRFVIKGKFDVIIVFKDGATMLACLIKILGVRSKLFVSERNTTIELTMKERIKFLLYRVADAIIPNSYSQSNFIKKNFPRLHKKVKVITNFTDIKEFSPIEFLPKNEILQILIIARIAPQKNVKTFMKVARKIKEANLPVKILWYGGIYKGQETYGEEIMDLYKRLDLEDVLEFRNATKDIIEAYRKCDVFCLPSIHEGYPNVLCEAMSCGKPIICSNICDNPYIVEDGVNGWLFNPHDEQDIFNKIKTVIDKPLLILNEIGVNNRKCAETNFSKEAFVQQYMELLEEYKV